MRYRIIIGTNVLLAALGSRNGASFHLLQKIGADPRLELCMSTALLFEYEEILARFRPDIPLSDDAIEAVLDYLCSVSSSASIYFRWRPTLNDPDDEFLLDLAVASQCHYVVSFNAKDLRPARSFGVEVVTPGELLRRLEEKS